MIASTDNQLNNFRFSSRLLLVIILVSLGLRVTAALVIGNEVQILPGTYDQVSYHNLSLRVLGGHGFSFGETWWPATRSGEPTAHWSYLYTFFLVLVYKIFGPQPLIARLIQAVIVGILHPLLVYRITRLLFSPRAGLIAAGITSIYAYFIYYSATLMTEPFYITSILASFYFSLELSRTTQLNSARGWMYTGLIGLSLVAAVLLRQLLLLWIPFLFLWLIWSRSKTTIWRILRHITVIGVILAFGIIPFSLYNYARFDRFVLLNTNAGYAFFWGNHPIHGTHFFPILPPEMGTYQDLIPPELLVLDEAAMDQELLKQGLGFIRNDPGRYLVLSLSRIPEYIKFWPSPRSGLVSNLSRVGSFGLFSPFMLIGVAWVLRKRLLPPGKFIRSGELLLLMFAMIYTGIHILTWTLIRYRLPVDAVLIPFAAYLMDSLLNAFNQRRATTLPA